MKNIYFNLNGTNGIAKVFYDPTLDEMIVVKANISVESFVIEKGNVAALMTDGRTYPVSIIDVLELGMVA